MRRYELENNMQIKVTVHNKIGKEQDTQAIKKPAMKRMHKHEYYEIMIMQLFNSDCYYITQQATYKYDSCCAVLTAPGVAHMTDRRSNSYKLRLIVNFTRSYGEAVFDYLGIDIDKFFQNHVLLFSEKQIEKLIELGASMSKMNRKPEEIYNQRLLLTNFINILQNPVDVVLPKIMNNDVYQEIITYIKWNYPKSITIDTISKKFMVDKYVFCRKFKEVTGENFAVFLMRTRMNHARELLEDTSLPIETIAERVGYATAKYFSSKFKNYTGMSPSNYRKVHGKNTK